MTIAEKKALEALKLQFANIKKGQKIIYKSGSHTRTQFETMVFKMVRQLYVQGKVTLYQRRLYTKTRRNNKGDVVEYGVFEYTAEGK